MITPVSNSEGHAMALDLFSRKLVLLVEDEPLTALDIEHHLRSAGARVISAGYLDAALSMTGHPDLAGAVIDLCLGAQSAAPIMRRLADRNLAFVIHTGYATDALQREWPAARIIQKPATPDDVVNALAESLLTPELVALRAAHDCPASCEGSLRAQ
jgi:ActR/RegA family two-component response regulator